MLKTILALIGLAVLIPFAIVVFGFIYLFVADSIERKQHINNNNKNQ